VLKLSRTAASVYLCRTHIIAARICVLARLFAVAAALTGLNAAAQVKVQVVKAGPPSEWKAARVIEIKLVAPDLTNVGKALREDWRMMVDRRIYSVLSGELVVRFADLDTPYNHKLFQKPCMRIGETIHYRTQVEKLTGTVSAPGQPTFEGASSTTTRVELKRRRKCAELTLAE
jgi:hypothetical protein